MTRKKQFKDRARVSFVLSPEQFAHLNRMAAKNSERAGKIISLSEMIRSTLDQVYPMPKNNDLFQ